MAVAARLSIFDDFDGLFLAPGAFKGALIVVWIVARLDACKLRWPSALGAARAIQLDLIDAKFIWLRHARLPLRS